MIDRKDKKKILKVIEEHQFLILTTDKTYVSSTIQEQLNMIGDYLKQLYKSGRICKLDLMEIIKKIGDQNV